MRVTRFLAIEAPLSGEHQTHRVLSPLGLPNRSLYAMSKDMYLKRLNLSLSTMYRSALESAEPCTSNYCPKCTISYPPRDVHGGRNIFLMPAPRAFLPTKISSSCLSYNGPPLKPWRRAFFVTAELLFAELLNDPSWMLNFGDPV